MHDAALPSDIRPDLEPLLWAIVDLPRSQRSAALDRFGADHPDQDAAARTFVQRYADSALLLTSGGGSAGPAPASVPGDHANAWQLPPDALEAVLQAIAGGGDLARAGDQLRQRHPGSASAIDAILDLVRRQRPTLPQSIGPYRILLRLGRGGMGEVFLGRHRELGRYAAVKAVRGDCLGDERLRARFQREVRVISRLDHPHICKVFEVGEADTGPFMAMQWIRGSSLADAIAGARSETVAGSREDSSARIASSSSGPSNRTECLHVIGLVEKVARAVHAAHEAGVIHRDLKPSNVMLGLDGEPMVLDFGLAREDVAHSLDQASSEALVGTLPYMAPEQIEPRGRALDRRCDVYALGVALYECLTLALPFTGRNPVELMRRIVTGGALPARRRNRRVPWELETVVEKAMDPDPGRRYRTALELAEDLARVRNFEPVRASRVGPLLRARRWSQRNPVAAVVLVLMTLGVGVTSVLLAQVSEARAREQVRSAETEAQAGRLAAADGDWTSALSRFDRAAALGHADPVALDLGRFHALEGLARTAEAVDVLTGLVGRVGDGPHLATVRLLAGVDALGSDPEHARAAIGEALDLDKAGASRLSPADRCFAQALLAPDLAAARDLLREALTQDRRHPLALGVLGPVLLFHGEPEAALRFADDYQLLLPAAPEPRWLRVMALALTGQTGSAREALAGLADGPARSFRPLLAAVVDLVDVLEREVGRWAESSASVVSGLRGHTRFRMPPPPLEVPARPADGAAAALRRAVPLLLRVLLSVSGGSLAREEGGALRLRVHPWILERYSLGRAQQTMRYVQAPKGMPDWDQLLPEASLGLVDPAAPDLRGLTYRLPGRRRLAAAMAFSDTMPAQFWEDFDESGRRMRPPGPADEAAAAIAAEALALPLSENELLFYGFFIVVRDLPGCWDLVDRLLVRWRELHGSTGMWLLFKAEVLLLRGARAEAMALVEQARAEAPDHAWVASLLERIAR